MISSSKIVEEQSLEIPDWDMSRGRQSLTGDAPEANSHWFVLRGW